MRFLALILVFALVACGGAGESEPAAEAEATPAVEPTSDADAQPEVETAAYAVGDKVELTGVVGCGHCNYHATEGCAKAIQVGDVVYVLDGIEEDTEAFNEHAGGQEMTIVGTLTDDGDPKHVQVESHKM